jgi:hypothetical protein
MHVVDFSLVLAPQNFLNVFKIFKRRHAHARVSSVVVALWRKEKEEKVISSTQV